MGFNVYGPQAGTTYAVGGAQPGLGGNAPSFAADVNSSARGQYVVQVFNYAGRDLDFQVWVTGPGVSTPQG